MADRLFAGVLLLVAIAYTWIAFTVIEAPFQYDPLGPETWPRLIGLVAIACLVYVIVKPDVAGLDIGHGTLGRLALVALALFVYAWLYEKIGFILSTFAFCLALSTMLGARLPRALVFAAVTSVAGYVVCDGLLELNLPEGPIIALLR